MKKPADIKQHVQEMLTERLDHPLRDHGFVRRRGSTVYAREIGEAKQIIDVAYDVGPRYAPEADAHVLPVLRVLLARVNEVALRMVGGDTRLLAGAEVTLFEPLDFVAPKSEAPRWLPSGYEGFLETGAEVRAFIERWAIPFLNEYQTAEALVRGYEGSDWRLLLMQHSYIFVAAAYVVVQRPADAERVLEKHLGKPGLRKEFSAAFAFIEGQL